METGFITVVYTVRLSFGEIPWFDDQRIIQRCDWLKRTHSLEIVNGHIQKAFLGQSQCSAAVVGPPPISQVGVDPKTHVLFFEPFLEKLKGGGEREWALNTDMQERAPNRLLRQ